MSGADEISRISARLGEIATALRDQATPPERADELAREAADLVARAGNEIDRAVAQAEDERE